MYSLPLTRSSDSLRRNLRSRGFEANEITIRSSSLSTHAGGFPPLDILPSSPECCRVTASPFTAPPDGPESRKKSL